MMETRNYRKIKAILEHTSASFTEWKPWQGAFSISNNYPTRNSIELTLLNRSTNHCICGHRCGKLTRKIGMLSIADSTPDTLLDEAQKAQNERSKLALSDSYLEASLVPYFKDDKFILVGKTCVQHFNGTNTPRQRTIYTRTNSQIYTMCIPLIFNKSGLVKKIKEVSSIRHLPDNMFYFATCVGLGAFEISKLLDPYGFKDLKGINRIIHDKKVSSPIQIMKDVVLLKCRSDGIDVGDVVYLSLKFITKGFASICIIKEHTIFYSNPTITVSDIKNMRE